MSRETLEAEEKSEREKSRRQKGVIKTAKVQKEKNKR